MEPNEILYDESKFVTKAQLEKWLGINTNQRRAFQDKGLPFIRLGNTTLYYLPSVCAWLKAHETRRPG